MSKSRDKRDRFIAFWKKFEAEDVGTLSYEELAAPHENGIETLMSLYDLNEGTKLSGVEKQKVAGEIDFIHSNHKAFIQEISDQLGSLAARVSVHKAPQQSDAANLAMDASLLMDKAIARGDASSAAYLSFVYTALTMASIERDVYKLYSKLGEIDGAVRTGKSKVSTSAERKKSVLKGFESLCAHLGYVPSQSQLKSFLSSCADNQFETRVAVCPNIYLEGADDETEAPRIYFSFRLRIGGNLGTSSISYSTYSREYKKPLDSLDIFNK